MRYVVFSLAFIWVLLILYPLAYCVEHGCSGPVGGQNIDGFLPAVGFTPVGAPALIWSLFVLIRRLWRTTRAADKE
jgi:hypothetical protein